MRTSPSEAAQYPNIGGCFAGGREGRAERVWSIYNWSNVGKGVTATKLVTERNKLKLVSVYFSSFPSPRSMMRPLIILSNNQSSAKGRIFSSLRTCPFFWFLFLGNPLHPLPLTPPSPQLVSLLFHSEKVEGKRGRGGKCMDCWGRRKKVVIVQKTKGLS